MVSPEVSRTVSEISGLSPRKLVPSALLSWPYAETGAKKRRNRAGARNRRARNGALCMEWRISEDHRMEESVVPSSDSVKAIDFISGFVKQNLKLFPTQGLQVQLFHLRGS
jgi:hypothetical protein